MPTQSQDRKFYAVEVTDVTHLVEDPFTLIPEHKRYSVRMFTVVDGQPTQVDGSVHYLQLHGDLTVREIALQKVCLGRDSRFPDAVLVNPHWRKPEDLGLGFIGWNVVPFDQAIEAVGPVTWVESSN